MTVTANVGHTYGPRLDSRGGGRRWCGKVQGKFTITRSTVGATHSTLLSPFSYFFYRVFSCRLHGGATVVPARHLVQIHPPPAATASNNMPIHKTVEAQEIGGDVLSHSRSLTSIYYYQSWSSLGVINFITMFICSHDHTR